MSLGLSAVNSHGSVPLATPTAVLSGIVLSPVDYACRYNR